MPPNRFESEVESFLEGSHGDRTHIKRADHPRLHHYAGRYWQSPGLLAPSGPVLLPARDSLRGLVTWFLRNVARNSPTRISSFEIASLELQRFGASQKVRAPELRASFGL